MYLHVQMLSYSSDTSQETDTHTDTQRYRDQEMEYLVHRQEIQEAAEYHKTVDHIVQRIIVKGIDQSQRYCRTDQTDQHTFQHKGRTKKSVAPIYFIILISAERTEIPIATVLLIRKMLTASRITMIPMDT